MRARLLIGLVGIVVLITLQGTIPAVSLESGPTLRALKLNGTDAYLEVDSGPALGELDAITIEAWIYRRDQTGCETIVGHNYRESYWFGTCTGGKLRFYPRGLGSSVDSNGAVPAGRWTHVAVTHDGGTIRFYINGLLDRDVGSPGGLGSSTALLGIGVDIATMNEGYDNFFRGMLDDVRIWGVARSPAEIQGDMLGDIHSWYGLLGIWRLDGSYVDPLGNHHTSEKGDVRYDTGGVVPWNFLHLPVAQHIPDIDGECGVTEYNVAERVALRSNERTVYLHHSATDLYVCIDGLWQDSGGDDLAIVAIDHNLSRDALAQSDDYRYIIERDGDMRAERGNGAGGYVPITLPAGSWAATVDVQLEFYWSAEFRISRASPGPWAELFGLDILASGDAPRPPADHFPAGAIENNPSTWSRVIIRDDGPSVPPLHLFSGRVEDSAEAGLSGVRVRLYSSNGAIGGSLIATTSTNNAGHYTFEYRGYAPNWFHVVEEDPRGAYSVDADAGEDGEAVSLNLLAYRGVQAGKTYSAGRFVDSLGAGLAPAPFNRHYLIVYGEPVVPGDLTVLVDMKRLQGFHVEVISVAEIESDVPGLDRRDKIRNWLKSRWQVHHPAPVYALLVGRGDVIPVADYGRPYDNTITWTDPGYIPVVQSEWYYADLDSVWDIDGDRVLGECLDSNVPCPPDSPVIDEGPFGTSPGREDDWVPEITVGRIPLKDRAEVQSALATVVDAEVSGSPDKRHGLVAGAFMNMEYRRWNEETGAYEGTWDGVRPYGHDTADPIEAGLTPIVEERLDTVTQLYNTTSPSNNPIDSPSLHFAAADMALTHHNILDVWQNQRFGIFNASGHSGEHGIPNNDLWTNEYDQPGVINHPANPDGTPGCVTGRCWELTRDVGSILDINFPPSGNDVAPVIYAHGCATGQNGWDCLWYTDPLQCPIGMTPVAGILAARGITGIWYGASSTLGMGPDTHGLRDSVFAGILSEGLLAGDALWKGNQSVAAYSRTPYWPLLNMMIYGDPAYSYWGNPLDTRAYWPQAGRDWYGSGASPASGPSMPTRLWMTDELVSGTASSIDRSGNIYSVGFDSIVVRAPDGTIIDSQSVPMDGPLFPPAITTDGVYVFSSAGLTVLDPELNVRETFPHDEDGQLYSSAVGAPVAGPDGVVWLPTADSIVRYTPGRLEAIPSHGLVFGRLVLAKDGAAIWPTFDGQLRRYHRDRFGVVTETALLGPGDFLGDPTVAPGNRVLVGRGSDLVSVNATAGGVQWTFDTGAAISAAPAVGPTGVAYAGNTVGEVVAVNAAGALLWRRALGAHIGSQPAVDSARVYVTAGSYLYALDTANGEVVWSADLGAPVLDRDRGGPVIGSNRTIYITLGDGRIVAVGQSLWLVAPSDFTINSISGGVTAYWRDNSQGELGFRVDRCDGENCVFVGLAPANAEAMTIQQMPIGETFTFRIQAVGGLSESRSATASMESSDFVFSLPVTPLPLAALPPTALTATPGSPDAIDLTWQYAGNRNLLLGFDIFRAEQAAGPYEKVAVVGSDASDYRDVNLQPATTYHYRVVTVNAAGSSPPAGPVSATTKPHSLPMPTGLLGEVGPAGVALSWQDNAATESGYLVERQVPGGVMQPLILLPADSKTYVDNYLLVEGNSRYRVRAISGPADSPPAETTVTIGGQELLFLPVIRR